MPRVSSIKRLPPEVRDIIGKLREQGRTLDEILEALRPLDVTISRSALGRHTKRMDAIAAKLEESQVIADALVRRMGETPESKTTRLNMQMMQTAMYRILGQALGGDEDGQGAGNFTTKETMELARALDHLTRAAKNDADLIARVREEARKEACEKAAEAAAVAGRQQGLDENQVAFIRAEILGVEVAR